MAIFSVIKSEAPQGTLVWKHPAEDFNTNSKLIVDESQVALLYKNGQIADIFTAGRYVLSTQNIPILRKLIELPTGGVSTFSCGVYFVNMTEAMNIKWGLNSRISYVEPIYQIPVMIGARGSMSVRVRDPRNLVVNLVGTQHSFTAETLTEYFRSMMVMRVKSYLTRTIIEQHISLFTIDGELELLAQEMKKKIVPELEHYGIDLCMFTVDEILKPEDDPMYLRVKRALSERSTGLFEAETRRQEAIISANASASVESIRAQGHAEALRVQGTTYQEERQFDISEKMVSSVPMNQYTGMAANMAMLSGTMAMGAQTARTLYQAAGATPVEPAAPVTTFAPAIPATPAAVTAAPVTPPAPPAAPAPAASDAAAVTKVCRNCGKKLPFTAKFCFDCGSPQPKLCPSCHTEVPDGAKFCLECGSRL